MPDRSKSVCFTILFVCAVAGSLLSQIPKIMEAGYDLYLKFLWLPVLMYSLIRYPKDIMYRRFMPFVWFVAIFAVYCLIMDTVTMSDYLGQDLYNIIISLVICKVSFDFALHTNIHKEARIVGRIVFVVSVYLGLMIFLEYIVGADLSGRNVAYKAKNSMGQILLACMVFSGFLSWPKVKLMQIVYVSGFVLLGIVIFMLKSRATLVSAGFVYVYLLMASDSRKLRMGLWICIGLVAVYALMNISNLNSIVEDFVYAGRDVTDMDSLSSHRVTIFYDRWELFNGSWLTGIGNVYFDCFPVAILIQYGIIGFLIFGIFLIWCFKYVCFRFNRRGNAIDAVTFLLFFAYIINSLFEAFPPFGPGAKCFFVWMAFGFSLAQYTKNSKFKFARRRYPQISGSVICQNSIQLSER